MLTYLGPILAAAAAVAIWLVWPGRDPGTNSARLGAASPSPPTDVTVAIAGRDPGTNSARFGTASPSSPTDLAVEIERRGVAMRSGSVAADEARGSVAQVGDVVRSTVRGESHRAIWVYFDDRDLVTACPDGSGCSKVSGGLTLELRVSASGRYLIIAISSAQPIVTPHGPLDAMLASIAAAGAHFKITHVDVN